MRAERERDRSKDRETGEKRRREVPQGLFVDRQTNRQWEGHKERYRYRVRGIHFETTRETERDSKSRSRDKYI